MFFFILSVKQEYGVWWVRICYGLNGEPHIQQLVSNKLQLKCLYFSVIFISKFDNVSSNLTIHTVCVIYTQKYSKNGEYSKQKLHDMWYKSTEMLYKITRFCTKFCTKSHDFVRPLSGVMQINTYLMSKRPDWDLDHYDSFVVVGPKSNSSPFWRKQWRFW